MYYGACLLHGPGGGETLPASNPWKDIFNNSYFIALTGIIVVAGNYYFNRLRQELSRVRDQLAQAEKMASLGQMSAGFIHEINNPLNYATSGLYALRKQSKYLPEERRADYEETVVDVQDGINRVNNIVSNLRIFTHPMFMRPEASDLDTVEAVEIVNEAVRGVSHLARDPMRIINNVPAQLSLQADRQKLVQVVENLMRNSLDALAAKPANGEPPTVWIEGRTAKDRCILTVRDNGPGIKPENLARVFDPFFTTKDVGKGMGLGLTVCQGIVQAYGGTITVRSEPGKFCEFLLEFPGKP
jgi:two-component system sensor histidine kinase PhcS